MNFEEMQKLVETLRAQAKQLEATADALEMSLAPWKAQQAVMTGMAPFLDFWKAVLSPIKAKD